MANLINRLPLDIRKEILYFIIPEPTTVGFSKNPPLYFTESYSHKYDVAFVDNKIIKNGKGEYLSRIAKKNGKHRYYLTWEIECCYCIECGDESNQRCCKNRNMQHDIYYKNKYLGKNSESAFITLMTM
jgi:hypothetical protein